MVNYIRINQSRPEELVGAKLILWDDEKYLKPVAIDNWLMFGEKCIFVYLYNYNGVILFTCRLRQPKSGGQKYCPEN